MPTGVRKFPRLYARTNTDSVPGWPRTDGTTAESSSGHTKADCHRSGLGATTMATCARRPSTARIGAGPKPNQGPLGGRRGDSNLVGVRAQLETPLPQSLPQSSAVTGSRPTLALVAAAPNSQESQPAMPSMCALISWGQRSHRTRPSMVLVMVDLSSPAWHKSRPMWMP